MNIKKMFLRLSIALLVLYSLQTLADDMVVQTFTLQNRTATDMIPLLQPVLPAGSVVTGNGYNLIIKTTPVALKDAQQIITQLDLPPQSLSIHVRRIHNAQADEQLASNSVTTWGTQSNTTQDQEKSVTVQDGQSAFVQSGSSFPYHDYGISILGATDITQYKDVKSGVILTPHLAGNNVSLTISWQFNQLQRDGTLWEQQNSPITHEKTDTTITVPLGQWVNISGISTQDLPSKDTQVYSTYNVQNPDSNLYVMIEKVM